MMMMKDATNGFRVFNTIAFVVSCIAFGHVTATSLTNLLCGVNTFEILAALKDPRNSAPRSVVILPGLFYTLFSFLIIPVLYLLLVNRRESVSFLWVRNKISIRPLILSTVTVFTIIPFVNVLNELNHSIQFPIWLADLESYFKEGEERVRQLTTFLLAFTKFTDLLVAIFIMAIIPGIVEELFFRGIVQTELQRVLKNNHAILIAAFLFSVFHFQFYGFIPRLALGGLLGYIFFNTNNIWYACAAHVVNNLMIVLGAFVFGPQFLNGDSGGIVPIVLLIPSIVITVVIVLFLKRTDVSKIHA